MTAIAIFLSEVHIVFGCWDHEGSQLIKAFHLKSEARRLIKALKAWVKKKPKGKPFNFDISEEELDALTKRIEAWEKTCPIKGEIVEYDHFFMKTCKVH